MTNDGFRNIDRPAAPQTVTVTFSRQVERDGWNCSPDEHDAGFWPSRNPTDAGYVMPSKFTAEMRKAKARMAAWQRDEWHYCGVYCRAHVSVPAGQGAFTLYAIDGAGVWGIESDSGDYLDEVYQEQKAELIAQLRTMGAAFMGLPNGE